MDKVRPSPGGEGRVTLVLDRRWSGTTSRTGTAWSPNQESQGERWKLDIILMDEILPGESFPVMLMGLIKCRDIFSSPVDGMR